MANLLWQLCSLSTGKNVAVELNAHDNKVVIGRDALGSHPDKLALGVPPSCTTVSRNQAEIVGADGALAITVTAAGIPVCIVRDGRLHTLYKQSGSMVLQASDVLVVDGRSLLEQILPGETAVERQLLTALAPANLHAFELRPPCGLEKVQIWGSRSDMETDQSMSEAVLPSSDDQVHLGMGAHDQGIEADPNTETASQKRKADAGPTKISPSSTPADVLDWLSESLPAEDAERIRGLPAARGLDGAALLALTEAAMREDLLIGAFGMRRKLTQRIRELAEELAAESPPHAASAAGLSPPAAESAAAAAADDGAPSVGAQDLDEATVEAQLNAEASCVGVCRWVLGKFGGILNAHAGWASQLLAASRAEELKRLSARCVLPTASIVLVGNTGAGKSTLLNALLNETALLPTNGMRACTAVIIELSHRAGAGYAGEVEFISKNEWNEELEDMLGGALCGAVLL
jgi:hypothetical protein